MSDTQGTLEERAERIARQASDQHGLSMTYAVAQTAALIALTEAADEIASLRAALTEIAAMEIPTEFQAKGDPASGRIWRSYQAGCFGRCQDIARQALNTAPSTGEEG